MFKAIYEDPNNYLTWPKVLIMNKGTEYLGECRDLLLSHGVKIIQAKSKCSISIAEHDHQEFEKHAYICQDAVDFYLPLFERCRSWVKAVKKALKAEKIIANPSINIVDLLDLMNLEFGRRRITDMNWSPKVYHIKESLIQKNQPVLYWLIDENEDGPERSFVRGQLMKVELNRFVGKPAISQKVALNIGKLNLAFLVRFAVSRLALNPAFVESILIKINELLLELSVNKTKEAGKQGLQIEALQVTSTIAPIMSKESEDTGDEALIFKPGNKVMIFQSRIITFGNIPKALIDSDGENMGIDLFED
ncbi:4234_t:CDS:2 [Cetraspora pellucida]|uniref:4234_t:CDS:1 n=1 Tax=Cetraspora pellucida TaxID=1433469 RepID=A0A9N8ZSV6_9GLOM|nr:4234_t:CDS:2 [Cetraspora pellucida]